VRDCPHLRGARPGEEPCGGDRILMHVKRDATCGICSFMAGSSVCGSSRSQVGWLTRAILRR
jgi:hypothetical protein